MSSFEVIHGYKHKKLIDLIFMTQHPRVSESASALASHVHDLHKKSVRKFRKIMLNINLMLICTVGALNLIKVIM